MTTEDREKVEAQLAEAVEQMEAAMRADDTVTVADTAPGIPYADLTPEQKAARMAAAKPAGWGTPERITNANMVAARMLSQGPR